MSRKRFEERLVFVLDRIRRASMNPYDMCKRGNDFFTVPEPDQGGDDRDELNSKHTPGALVKLDMTG